MSVPLIWFSTAIDVPDPVTASPPISSVVVWPPAEGIGETQATGMVLALD